MYIYNFTYLLNSDVKLTFWMFETRQLKAIYLSECRFYLYSSFVFFWTVFDIWYVFSDPYIVEQAGYSNSGNDYHSKDTFKFPLKTPQFLANDIIASTVKEIGKQFRQAFMVEETKRDIYTKVKGLIQLIFLLIVINNRWRA